MGEILSGLVEEEFSRAKIAFLRNKIFYPAYCCSFYDSLKVWVFGYLYELKLIDLSSLIGALSCLVLCPFIQEGSVLARHTLLPG